MYAPTSRVANSSLENGLGGLNAQSQQLAAQLLQQEEVRIATEREERELQLDKPKGRKFCACMVGLHAAQPTVASI